MAKSSKKQIVESAEAAVETETDDELEPTPESDGAGDSALMQSPSPPCLVG